MTEQIIEWKEIVNVWIDRDSFHTLSTIEAWEVELSNEAVHPTLR